MDREKFRFNPKNQDIPDELCRALIAGLENDHGYAIDIIDNIIKRDENNSLLWIVKAMACEKQKKYEDAHESIEKALELDKNSALAWNVKGWIDFGLGKYMDALESYDNSVKYSDESEIYESLLAKTSMLTFLGKNDDALNTVNELLNKFPQDMDGLYYKSQILKNSKKYNEALRIIKQGLEIAPDAHYLSIHAGEILLETRRLEKALEYFIRAIDLYPEDYDAWMGKTTALLFLNRREEYIHALKIMEKLHWSQRTDDEKYDELKYQSFQKLDN